MRDLKIWDEARRLSKNWRSGVQKMCVFFGKTKKKQAALNAIAAHCAFKINASFYLFAFLLSTFFLSTFTGSSSQEIFAWRYRLFVQKRYYQEISQKFRIL